jgi:hypothetical protein
MLGTASTISRGGNHRARHLIALVVTWAAFVTMAVGPPTASPSAAIVHAPATIVRQDQARLFVADRVGGLALLGRVLYWHTDCGGDFAPAQSRLRALASRIWARRRTKASGERKAASRASRSASVRGRTYSGAFPISQLRIYQTMLAEASTRIRPAGRA